MFSGPGVLVLQKFSDLGAVQETFATQPLWEHYSPNKPSHESPKNIQKPGHPRSLNSEYFFLMAFLFLLFFSSVYVHAHVCVCAHWREARQHSSSTILFVL